MTKFLIHGGYFSRNYGDYVLIDKTIKKIKSVTPHAEVGLAMAPASVREEFKNTIDNITIKNILSVDKVLFTGGGYLGERDFRIFKWSILCVYRQILLPIICIIFNKPYAYFGVEVGPLRYKFLSWLVGRVLDRAKFVLVRNEFSRDFCLSIMKNKSLVSLATDFAQNKKFLSSYDSSGFILNEGEKYIGIHVTKYLSKYNDFCDDISRTIKSFENKDYKIVFFTDSPSHNNLINDELFIFKDVFDKEKHIFIPYKGPELTTCLLGSLSAVITSKLHVGIVGLTMGCVPLSLPSHNKTIHYYNQVGYPELCLYKSSSDTLSQSLKRFIDLVDSKSISLPSKSIEAEKLINLKIKEFVTN